MFGNITSSGSPQSKIWIADVVFFLYIHDDINGGDKLSVPNNPWTLICAKQANVICSVWVMTA